ncbi:flagellar hook capping FlgD N-terminal domain-containing protein [Sinomonas sp. JGH33]|uniref:Flagellar hook capping FlgD N-terminal domain-containing protein n=1 Tax=Sinomonas terricola TaxID=3110330 RepID=A0ABU5TC84_9MICC|nr:flagellar hook capping FlgD N-terminal domain-containing protein [Sinomonas sp. JGH33]MEA5457152.1 flagellar hook capping FlgD N-terminal domain-containing protein [Sinomonas sp. JGH33]
MSISPIAAPVGPTSLTSAAPTRAPQQTMDSTVFMSLLVTQLKNQDPSSPMDTNAMISQTTQLSMMEKLTQLATDSASGLSVQQRSEAAALLGRSVTYLTAGGASGSGTVGSVSYSGSVPSLSVGGASIPLTAITGITGA